MTKSLLIGCGNLGQNIISGFYKKKKQVLICDKNKNLLKQIKKNYKNFFEVLENLENISFKKIEYIFLCIKPQQALAVPKVYLGSGVVVAPRPTCTPALLAAFATVVALSASWVAWWRSSWAAVR